MSRTIYLRMTNDELIACAHSLRAGECIYLEGAATETLCEVAHITEPQRDWIRAAPYVLGVKRPATWLDEIPRLRVGHVLLGCDWYVNP